MRAKFKIVQPRIKRIYLTAENAEGAEEKKNSVQRAGKTQDPGLKTQDKKLRFYGGGHGGGKSKSKRQKCVRGPWLVTRDPAEELQIFGFGGEILVELGQAIVKMVR